MLNSEHVVVNNKIEDIMIIMLETNILSHGIVKYFNI
jgi:hypothetical protein